MINLAEHRNIHCIGIGGIGLSGIAEILLIRGYNVSGSDLNRSDITERLSAKGAKVYYSHSGENVEDADLIIYSAAIAEENPEIVRAREKGIPLASRAEVLGLLMDEFKESIAISGTHGKTTTTSMVSLILEKAKYDPTILIGGDLAEIGGNFKVGEGNYFITEACEYRDSFLELRPTIEVILNIDSDHLDYFKDIDHIVQSFQRFTDNVRPGGIIVAYDSNPFVNAVIKDLSNVVTYGYNSNSTYSIQNIKFEPSGMPSFDVYHKGESLGHVTLSVPGEHNILNAIASFACCHQLGVKPEIIVETLGEYHGTKRRFDIIGETEKGALVIDDYAHHPTEIKATLTAARQITKGKIWCAFQPHTYTRTLALLDEFASAFEDSDVLILAEIYASREKNIHNVSSKLLAERIQDSHPEKEVYFIPEFKDIAEKIRNEAAPGDLVITMGAGDINKVGDLIVPAQSDNQ